MVEHYCVIKDYIVIDIILSMDYSNDGKMLVTSSKVSKVYPLATHSVLHMVLHNNFDTIKTFDIKLKNEHSE